MNPKNFIKNSIFILFTNIISIISSLYLSVLVARSLGPELFGALSFILGFTGLFLFACDWGINLLIMNRVSKERKSVNQYIDNAFLPVLFLSAITSVAVYTVIMFLGYSSTVLNGITIGLIILLITALNGLFRGAFYAYEKMEYETITNLTERLSAIIFVSIAVFYGEGIIEILMAYLLSKICSFIICITLYRFKIAKLCPTFDINYTFNLIKRSLPFGINVMLSALYIQADVSLIAFIKGEQDVGLYRAANGLILHLPIIALMINNSIYPIMVSRNEDKEFVKRACEKSARLVLLIGLPITLFIFIFSDRIISILYGKEYADATIALMILIMALPLKLVSNSLATTLTAINRQMDRTKIIAIASGFSILVNILLISMLSYIGASITALLTEVIIFFLLLKIVNKYLLIKGLLKPLIISIPVFTFAYLLRNINELIVLGAIGIYSLFCLYFIFINYLKPEWKAIRNEI